MTLDEARYRAATTLRQEAAQGPRVRSRLAPLLVRRWDSVGWCAGGVGSETERNTVYRPYFGVTRDGYSCVTANSIEHGNAI